MIEILHRYTNAVIYKSETARTVKEAVVEAVKAKANLSYSDLRGSDLSYSKLRGSNLSYSNLRGSDLSYSNLRGSDLSGSDLSYSNLRGSDLRGSDLRGSDLSGSDLSGSDLSGSDAARLSIVPDGSLVVWKKCNSGILVKLRVPEDSRRSNATGRKCRCEFADVLEVIGADVGISQHDGKTEYRVGQRVTCDSWCEDRWKECAGGIHFYITREEAEEH